MKQYIIAGLLMFPMAAFAADTTINVDPDILGQQALKVICTAPTEREDNTQLLPGEIDKFSYYISTNNGPYINAEADTSACGQVFDLSQVPDATYTYYVTTVDTDARESVPSADKVIAIVKRQSNPNAPSGVSGRLE